MSPEELEEVAALELDDVELEELLGGCGSLVELPMPGSIH